MQCIYISDGNKQKIKMNRVKLIFKTTFTHTYKTNYLKMIINLIKNLQIMFEIITQKYNKFNQLIKHIRLFNKNLYQLNSSLYILLQKVMHFRLKKIFVF